MFDSVKAGREIAVQRKKMGLTQEELAVRLKISPQAVSKWENGHATVAISKYEEMISMCEKCLHSLSDSAPETAEESREKKENADCGAAKKQRTGDGRPKRNRLCNYVKGKRILSKGPLTLPLGKRI